MTWDPTPWSVGGGAEHSPELLRLLAHATTSGAEGVVAGLDCKVSALTVAAGSVNVAAGSVIIRNAYAGGGQQSYVARNGSLDVVAVSQTAGAAQSDLVVARILDPQYEGAAPADPNAFSYVRTTVIAGVPSGTTSVAGLGLTYPAFALARIDLPANTGAVAGGMIKDLRRIAAPRVERLTFSDYPSVVDEVSLSATLGSPDVWPNTATFQVAIPPWATRARMRADIVSAFIVTATAEGGFGVRLSNEAVQNSRWRGNLNDRLNLLAGGEIIIPVAQRGTTQAYRATAYRNVGTGGLRVDGGSSVLMELDLIEAVI